MVKPIWCSIAAVLIVATSASAENGHAAWLRYAPLAPDAAARAGAEVPRTVYRLGTDVLVQRAEEELRKGVEGMLGRPLEPVSAMPAAGTMIVGTLRAVRAAAPALVPAGDLPP